MLLEIQNLNSFPPCPVEHVTMVASSFMSIGFLGNSDPATQQHEYLSDFSTKC